MPTVNPPYILPGNARMGVTASIIFILGGFLFFSSRSRYINTTILTHLANFLIKAFKLREDMLALQ